MVFSARKCTSCIDELTASHVVKVDDKREIPLLHFLEFLDFMAQNLARVCSPPFRILRYFPLLCRAPARLLEVAMGVSWALYSIRGKMHELVGAWYPWGSSVQGLPILERMYPKHWIFREHPRLVAIGLDDPEHNVWEDWSRLTWDTFCHVSEHLQKSEECGLHSQRTPDFSPSPALLQGALRLGAIWTQWDRTPAEKLNPGLAMASKFMEGLLPAPVRLLVVTCDPVDIMPV